MPRLIANQLAIGSLPSIDSPGMPKGSPGMEGDAVEHYSVIAFDRDGKTRVYAKR